MPQLVIVAGPNGSGKTTLVRSGAISAAIDVPALSINADDIARSLAGDSNPTPEQSLRAAQMADGELDAAIHLFGSDAMIETVLSSDKFKAREADMVLVFDNSDNAPTLCGIKAADRWHLRHLSRLPADLTETIQRLAGHRAD